MRSKVLTKKSLYTIPSRPEPRKTVGCYNEYPTSQLGSVLQLNKKLVCLMYHTPRWWSYKCLLTHPPLYFRHVCHMVQWFFSLSPCLLAASSGAVSQEKIQPVVQLPHALGGRGSFIYSTLHHNLFWCVRWASTGVSSTVDGGLNETRGKHMKSLYTQAASGTI